MDLDELYKKNPSSLRKAVREGNIEVVRDLLRSGIAHPNSNDHRGWTSLHEAAAHNQLDIVKILLEDERTNPEAPTHSGSLPLNIAVEFNASVEVVIYLAQRTKPFRKIGYATRLLYDAAISASSAVVQYIISNTSVDIQGHYMYSKSSSVFGGLLRNNEEVVEVLLEACDDVNDLYDEMYHGRTILFAIEAGCTPPIIKMLVRKGAFLEFAQRGKYPYYINPCTSALTLAICRGMVDVAFELLKCNVDFNRVSQCTVALVAAVSNELPELVKVLLPDTSFEVLESLCEKPHFNGVICSALASYNKDIFSVLLNHNFSEPILEAPVCIRLSLQNPKLRYAHIGPLAFLLKEKMGLFGVETLSIMKHLLSKGICIEPRKLSYVPPLVAILIAWSRNDDTDPPRKALKMLLELHANVDYQSQSVLPDSLLTAAHTGNFEALTMLLPYSKYTPCDIVRIGIEHNMEFLWYFILDNMISVDDYLELRQFRKDNGQINRNYVELLHRFRFKVTPLSVLARRSVRRCLRTTRSSSEFLNIIENLEIPETLKRYLRFK